MLGQAAFPDDEWRTVRVLVFGLACAGALLAASGLLATKLFHQPTTIKYAVTVGGFAFVALLATVRAPLRLIVAIAILAGPVDAVVKLQGLEISPLIAIDTLGIVIALPRVTRCQSAIRSMTPVFGLLFIPGLALATSPGAWAVWLSVTLATGWLAFEVAREPGGIPFVVSMLLVSALVQALLAVWESKTKHQLYLYSSAGSTATTHGAFFQYGNLIRPQGTLPDPIGLGQFLALCLPLAIVYAAAARTHLAGVVALIAVGVAGLGLMLSLSRLSIVGGGIGVLLTLVLLPQGRRWFVVSGVVAVALGVVLISMSLGGRSLTARLASTLNPTAAHVANASSDQQRIQIWDSAIRIGEAFPLAGVGLGNVGRYLPRYGVPVKVAAEAQNTPLQYLAEAGIPGLIAVIMMVLAALRDLAASARRERLWAAGCFASLIATLITWSTDVAVRYVQLSGMVAVLFGLIAAIRVASRVELAAQGRAGQPSAARSWGTGRAGEVDG